jgi:hypothetical protein
MALENFEVEFIKDLRFVKVGLSFTAIGIAFFFFMILWTSPLREWCSNCCADRTGIERMRSFSEKPSLQLYLESTLDRMRGGLKQGII